MLFGDLSRGRASSNQTNTEKNILTCQQEVSAIRLAQYEPLTLPDRFFAIFTRVTGSKKVSIRWPNDCTYDHNNAYLMIMRL